MFKEHWQQGLLFVFVYALISLAVANTARVVINEHNTDLHIKHSEFKNDDKNEKLQSRNR